jgi:hypothetical protein
MPEHRFGTDHAGPPPGEDLNPTRNPLEILHLSPYWSEAAAVARRARMVDAMTHLLVLTKRAERLHRAFERAAAEQNWTRTNATARAFFRLMRPSAGV